MSDQPFLRVLRGNPTDEELAALTTVLLAAASAGSPPRKRSVGGWARPATSVRTMYAAGPGGWRASAGHR